MIKKILSKMALIAAIFSGSLVMLGMAGCNEEKKESSNQVIQSSKNSHKKDSKKVSSKKKSKKSKAVKKSSKKLAHLNYNLDDDNDMSFLDNISTEKALKAQEEISKLIAMLEEENKALQPAIPFEKPYQTVLFTESSTSVADVQAEVLAKNTKKALDAAQRGKKFIVRGHSDALESDYNDGIAEELARKRAEGVKNELVASGIPAEDIEISVIGANEPMVFNYDKAQQEKNVLNRRVEILTI